MQHPVNPYQPPATPQSNSSEARLDSDRIALHGQVEIKDVADLIERPWIFRVLKLVCLLFVSFFALIAVAVFVLNPTAGIKALAAIALVVVLAIILYGVNWLLAPRRRALRLVKANPGIVGPLHGWLDQFGLTYQSESTKEYFQISWAAFFDTEFRPEGMRLGWIHGGATMIAIPARCFDEYSVEAIRAAVQRFRESADEPAIFQVAPDWKAMPENAIRFQSLVKLKPPLTQQESRRLVIWNSIQAVAWILSVFCLLFFGMTAAIVMLLVPGLVSFIGMRDYKRAAPSPYALRQWGWVTRDAIRGHLPGNVYELRWADAVKTEINDESILVQFANGNGVILTVHDAIDGNWPELSEMISNTNAERSLALPLTESVAKSENDEATSK